MAIKVTSKKASRPRTTGATKKTRFSSSEKRAYELGQSYAAGASGGRVELKTTKEKQSFCNGMNKVNGTAKSKRR